MKFKIHPYSIQELGQRKNQEDSMFPLHGEATAEDRLFLVCDGMGGHDSGEVASEAACSSISKYIIENSDDNDFTENILKNAISVAYDKLDELDNGAEKKMGTTMTLLKLHSEGATIAHIGDSRVYHIRPKVGIIFVTTDHSLVNDLLKAGELTEEEAKNFPNKNVITRAMQPCLERRYNADIYHTSDIQPGDYFYLCSDGMLEEATDENIEYIFSLDISDKDRVKLLQKNSEENKDNHTAYIIKIEEVEESEEAEIFNNEENLETEEADASVYIPVNDEENIEEHVEIQHKKQLKKFYMCLTIIAFFIVGILLFYIYTNSSIKDTKQEEPTTGVKTELPFKTETKKVKPTKLSSTSEKENKINKEDDKTSQVEENLKQEESSNNNIHQETNINQGSEQEETSADKKTLKEIVASTKENINNNNSQNVAKTISDK